MVFGQSQQEISIMSNGDVNVKMSTEKEKWLKFYDRQYQFKVSFMLYADFESILKLINERYREKMNTIKAKRKVRYHIQKRYTHMYRHDGVYTVPLPMEMSLTL